MPSVTKASDNAKTNNLSCKRNNYSDSVEACASIIAPPAHPLFSAAES